MSPMDAAGSASQSSWFGIGVAMFWLACAISCRSIIPLLQRAGMQDVANERSSHTGAVPRGGGLGFVPILLAACLLVLWMRPDPFWLVAIAVAVGFALVSLADDRLDLSAAVRFPVYLVLSFALLWMVPAETLPEVPFLPSWLTRVLLALAFCWWVNLFNFMDGINGLTVTQTISMALPLAALLSTALPDGPGWRIAVLLATAASAFATVNWHPARVFMGDVGSITLGALTGALLLHAGAAGFAVAAVLVSLYYWGDATSTLVWRGSRGQKIWKAHSLHAYQYLVRRPLSHDFACLCVLALNVWLAALALGVVGTGSWVSLTLGIASTGAVLFVFRMLGKRPNS